MNIIDTLTKLIPLSGPIATIVAAIYVSKITQNLSRKQSDIANQQAITAERKLKLDLFDKRFAVFSAARRVAEIGLYNANPASKDYDKWPEFTLNYQKSLDGRFLFSFKTYAEIKSLVDLSDTYLSSVVNYQNKQDAAIDEIASHASDINNMRSRLLDGYNRLPDACSSELALDF